jgi:hypothetical protein
MSTDLFVVEVQEQRTEALAGRDGGHHLSPPQVREQAIELVELVLSQKVTVNGERTAGRAITRTPTRRFHRPSSASVAGARPLPAASAA